MSNELVFNQNGKVLTSSLIVAKTFGKEHARVMRDIRNIISSGAGAHNFVVAEYFDKQGKRQPMFNK